jgi:SAM-dependent methyltransferase
MIPAGVLARLRCPACGGGLDPDGPARGTTECLTCVSCGAPYPVRQGIPRFVPEENYAGNFGFQWNRFRRTQLDSHTGVPITARRFFDQVALDARALSGLTVLDAGCGAGRFAEVALDAGATVYGIDYSTAIEAAAANLSGYARFHPLQADLYRLPFARRGFDLVYCLGVLQHTPDVAGAFRALVDQVAPGGRLVVDVYRRWWRGRVHPKYLLRPLTTRMNQERLFTIIERATPSMLRLSRLIGRIPFAGRQLRKVVPVADYEGFLPLTPVQRQEWAVLDTFDWLAPRYDQPQDADTLRHWFENAGLEAIEVQVLHHLTGRGRVPVVEHRAEPDARPGVPVHVP